jgi:ABC-type branched-subunit amino acid transport system ATPase component
VSAPLLRVEGLVKAFHGNRAVDDVSFDVPAGRIVALLGENGAGKSSIDPASTRDLAGRGVWLARRARWTPSA